MSEQERRAFYLWKRSPDQIRTNENTDQGGLARRCSTTLHPHFTCERRPRISEGWRWL